MAMFIVNMFLFTLETFIMCISTACGNFFVDICVVLSSPCVKLNISNVHQKTRLRWFYGLENKP